MPRRFASSAVSASVTRRSSVWAASSRAFRSSPAGDPLPVPQPPNAQAEKRAPNGRNPSCFAWLFMSVPVFAEIFMPRSKIHFKAVDREEIVSTVTIAPVVMVGQKICCFLRGSVWSANWTTSSRLLFQAWLYRGWWRVVHGRPSQPANCAIPGSMGTSCGTLPPAGLV